jgi:hypothetical protein
MNLIIYDSKNVAKKNGSKWIVWCSLLLFICIFSIGILNVEEEENNLVDLWLFLLSGNDESSDGIPFPPFMWILIQASLGMLVGDYLYKELKENSFYVLLRVKRRFDWYIAKVVWVFITVVVFYCTILAAVLISSIWIDGDMNIWGTYAQSVFKSSFIVDVNPVTFFIFSFVSCFITSLLISIVQVVLTMVMKPIYSYLIIMGILLLSVYIPSPYLIGEYLLVNRYANVFQDGTFNVVYIYGYELVLFLIISFLGYTHFRKMNLV